MCIGLMELSPAVRAYYERGGELDRLAAGHGRLEFLRTQDVLRRVLPPPPARVLDVGGGTGVHARGLAADGYDVRVVDPVPLHVSHAASIPGVTAVVGDARRLDEPGAAYDAVVLLGPLYHLLDRVERVAALREAARVAVPGGVVAAATISRFAGLYDTLVRGIYADPDVRRIAWLLANLEEWLAEPGVLLDALRSIERDESLLGISSHLLTVATAPLDPV